MVFDPVPLWFTVYNVKPPQGGVFEQDDPVDVSVASLLFVLPQLSAAGQKITAGCPTVESVRGYIGM